MISFNKNNDSWNNIEEGIEFYYKNYPDKYYLTYPEFAINKLGLEKNLLESLNNDVKKRTREDIRNWMMDSKLTYQELIYVGW
jgi:hypothetical protein